jgi:antitoxin component of RelBE/YafQ-DinJ toxin-antitoxin module
VKVLAFLQEPAAAVSQMGMDLSTFLTMTLQRGELQRVPILTKFTGNNQGMLGQIKILKPIKQVNKWVNYTLRLLTYHS